MKIGILIWNLALQGGAQRQAVELAKRLSDNGDDVTIYAVYYAPNVYSDIVRGIRVRHLFSSSERIPWQDRSVAGVSLGALFYISSEWRRSRTISKFVSSDLDVLNAHENMVFTGAARWKRSTGKPVVWMMNDLPGVFFRPRTFSNRSANQILDFVAGRSLIRKWYLRAIRSLDRVVVLDRRNQVLLEDHVDASARIIRSGLDLEKFSYSPRRSYRGGRPFRIFSNGIFFPHRRLEDLVAGIRILNEEGMNLVWSHVGTDERHPKYALKVHRAIKDAALTSRCSLLGKVSDQDLVDLYQNADAFVFPNSPQTWGLAVFEAMACGTPVIVSRGAGASEVLTDGIDGLLVDPCRPDQIAAAIRSLADSQDLWTRLSTAGRAFVEANIRWDLYARKMREEMEILCH